MDAATTVGRPSTRAVEADRDPLDSLRPTVRARPEGGPGERATAPTRAARRRGGEVVGDGKGRAATAALPPDGGRWTWNEERVALAVTVAVDDSALLAAAHLDGLLKTLGAACLHLHT